MRTFVIALVAAPIARPGVGGRNRQIKLKNGPGPRQGGEQLRGLPLPRLHPDEFAVPERRRWDAEVTKMIKALGAPINDADAKAIADYLAKNYGT